MVDLWLFYTIRVFPNNIKKRGSKKRNYNDGGALPWCGGQTSIFLQV